MKKSQSKSSIPKNLSKASPDEVAKAFSGKISVLGSMEEDIHTLRLSTGIDSLDRVLGGAGESGTGGLPLGRIVEIYGPESSGKTTLGLHFCAQAQKANGKAGYIDAEHALDLNYAEDTVGVDASSLLFSQPDDSAEETLELVYKLFKSKALDVLVLDSVSSLIPKDIEEKEIGGRNYPITAMLLSTSLPKIQRVVKQANGVLIIVNQVRMKLNVRFGNPETTTGGNALKFYAGVRLRTSVFGKVKRKGQIVGIDQKVYSVKNKTARPFKTCILRLEEGKGYSEAPDTEDDKREGALE